MKWTTGKLLAGLLLTVCLIVLTAVCAGAEGTACSEGLAFTSNGDGTCYVSGIGTCTDGDIVIPPVSPAGDQVIAVGDGAFYQKNNLTGVVISNGITEIGFRAFVGCSQLKSITIPESVKRIEQYAFSGCTALEKINYNATESAHLSQNNYVFYNCGKYGKGIEVVVGANVTAIPAHLFSPCFSYTSDLSAYAPKIVSVRFEEGSVCKIIHGNAFSGCRSLTSVRLPEGLKAFDGSAFYDCTALESLRIPDSVTYMVNGWSVGGSVIQAVNGIHYLDNWAVGHDGDIIDAVLRPGTVGVGCYAFENYSLRRLYVPVGMKHVGEFSFDGHLNTIEDIYYEGTPTEWSAMNFGMCNNILGTATYHYNTSLGENGILYTANGDGTCSVSGWVLPTYADLEIPSVSPTGDIVIGIGNGAFTGASFTSVALPETLETIGDNAFSWNYSLRWIEIPASVTYIGGHAFGSCEGLHSAVIPADSKLTYIADCAFYYCHDLKSIYIPEGVTYLGNRAFGWCSTLREVTFASDCKLTEIGESAFECCGHLKSIRLPARVTSIGDYAFSPSMLTTVSFPAGLTNIGYGAFGESHDLTDAYYAGTKEDWSRVNVEGYNASLLNATLHFRNTYADTVYRFDSLRRVWLDENGATAHCIAYCDDGRLRYCVAGVPQRHGAAADADGYVYYFNSAKTAVRDCVYEIGEGMTNGLIPAGTYFADPQGRLMDGRGELLRADTAMNDGFKYFADGDVRYYVDGKPARAGAVADADGYVYYFNSAKTAVRDCVYEIGEGMTNGLIPAGTYFADPQGRLMDGRGELLRADTAMNDGFKYFADGDVRYYVDGKPARAGLVADGEGSLYYFNGTLKAVRGARYSFGESMANGLLPAGTYSFDENGKLILP